MPTSTIGRDPRFELFALVSAQIGDRHELRAEVFVVSTIENDLEIDDVDWSVTYVRYGASDSRRSIVTDLRVSVDLDVITTTRFGLADLLVLVLVAIDLGFFLVGFLLTLFGILVSIVFGAPLSTLLARTGAAFIALSRFLTVLALS